MTEKKNKSESKKNITIKIAETSVHNIMGKLHCCNFKFERTISFRKWFKNFVFYKYVVLNALNRKMLKG